MLFFFQAEDGIRDLVRSRGLGDVYKRQEFELAQAMFQTSIEYQRQRGNRRGIANSLDGLGAVSYTHLTLPTSDLV